MGLLKASLSKSLVVVESYSEGRCAVGVADQQAILCRPWLSVSRQQPEEEKGRILKPTEEDLTNRSANPCYSLCGARHDVIPARPGLLLLYPQAPS